MTYSDEKGRGTPTATLPKERAAPAKRPQQQIVRWIEFLGLLGFAAVAALGLWFLAGADETTDGSFEVAEEMRFERIQREAGVADLGSQVTVSTNGFDIAERMRFQAIADAAGVTTLMSDGSADHAEMLRFQRLAPPGVLIIDPGSPSSGLVRPDPVLVSEMQELADIYEGDYFGYLPPNHWFLQEMQELADIYEGDYFGWLPEDYWATQG